jgi:DNA-binding transcriptional ArsR family regulator
MGTPAHSLDFGPTAAGRPEASPDGPFATGLAVVNQHDAAGALLNPLRRSILTALAAPGSATSVADAIGTPRQLVNYHLRVLERAGLVEEVAQRQRRGLTERIVRATAAHYLVSPDAIAQLGGSTEDVSDRFSASYQVAVAARTIREVAALAALARKAGKPLSTLSLDTQVCFETPAAREAFGNELVATLNALVAKYHCASESARAAGKTGRTYRLFAGAHPIYQPAESPEPASTKRRRKTRKRSGTSTRRTR